MATDDSKTKVYKNANRRPDKVSKYVPQYQTLGVEPEEYKSPVPLGSFITMAKTPYADGGHARHRPIVSAKQPYAEAVETTSGMGRGPIPNVGNNIEQTWVEEIVDDISELDPHHPMIDNNDFVSDETLGVNQVEGPVVFQPSHEEDLENILHAISEEEYILLVAGTAVCSGQLSFVEEQTRALLYGNHEVYKTPVPVDDIMVFKKIKIKIGVFLQ